VQLFVNTAILIETNNYSLLCSFQSSSSLKSSSSLCCVLSLNGSSLYSLSSLNYTAHEVQQRRL